MGPLRRLAAHRVLTPDGLRRGMVVTVDARGTILEVRPTEAPDREHGVEFYSGILIPGMVNAHCHLELSHMKGMIPEGCGFAGFGRAMGELRSSVGEDGQRQCAAYHDAKMWAEGISAVGDISNCAVTAPVKGRSHIAYHTFVEVYGLGLHDTQRFTHLLRLIREQGQRASLTPHSMYSLDDGLLRETVEGDDGIISVHFMESEGEGQLFKGEGEMRRWYDRMGWEADFTAHYRSPAERLVSIVPPERKVLLVHNTFVTEEDIDRITGHFGRNVTWVLCPRSNRHITGRGPDVALMRRKGCRIAVGTDSLASNTALSVLEELKMLDAPLEELLGWATVSGAEALGMEADLGTLSPGKRPGVALIEGADLNSMRLTESSTVRRLV